MSFEISLNPDVVCSTLDDGGVLLDLETKQYFALNATALRLWQHLDDGGTLAAVEFGAHSAQDGRARADAIEIFARALVSHGLAMQGDTVEGPAARTTALVIPEPWVAPTVTPHGRPLSQVILSPFDPTVPIPE